MDFGFQQFGKFLILLGIVIAAAGAVMFLLAHLGFFKLPGDIELSGKNWKIYFPIVTCLLISIVLTVVFWLINYFRS